MIGLKNIYVGHPSQLCDVEQVQLMGGKGNGMRLLKVRNAAGLSFDVSADRCADISRLFFKGDNVGYFTACGYVAPAFYQEKDFLKSFTAGFLTTCGLENAGGGCTDGGKEYFQHGNIANVPCDRIWWDETETEIQIHAVINDGCIFGTKLRLFRTITCGKFENKMTIADTVENYGDTDAEIMLLYHVNLGYPMLSEAMQLDVNSDDVVPSSPRAAEGLETWNQMLPPAPQFAEQCYFHSMSGEGVVKVYNPDIKKGMQMQFDTKQLPHFTQWKQMGQVDYALGLEPGTCNPLGRVRARERGQLLTLQPGAKKEFRLHFSFFE